MIRNLLCQTYTWVGLFNYLALNKQKRNSKLEALERQKRKHKYKIEFDKTTFKQHFPNILTLNKQKINSKLETLAVLFTEAKILRKRNKENISNNFKPVKSSEVLSSTKWLGNQTQINPIEKFNCRPSYIVQFCKKQNSRLKAHYLK